MRILCTNDDGIYARGLEALVKIARELSDDVWVVAPQEEQSGAARALTRAVASACSAALSASESSIDQRHTSAQQKKAALPVSPVSVAHAHASMFRCASRSSSFQRSSQ